MPLRQDVLDLLFSMTSLRGIFQTFYAGGNRPTSSAGLAERLSASFPSIPLLTVAEASIVLHSAFESGQALSGFLNERQGRAGVSWPPPGGVPFDHPFAEPIGGVNPPTVPGFEFPGVSHGSQVYEVVYSIEVTTNLGTRDTRHLTAMVQVGTGGTYADLLNALQSVIDLQADTSDFQFDPDAEGRPDLSTVDVLWGVQL